MASGNNSGYHTLKPRDSWTHLRAGARPATSPTPPVGGGDHPVEGGQPSRL